MTIVYRYEFEVEGSGRFPIDMLRYDGCFPACETDANKIERANYDHVKRYRIKLVKFWERGWKPTFGRWASLCWAVDEDSLTSRKF